MRKKRGSFLQWLYIFLLFPVFGRAAEKFPTKSIELDVPFAAGGSTDVLARLVAKYAPKYFDKPLVIVNKPGGGGVTGTEGSCGPSPMAILSISDMAQAMTWSCPILWVRPSFRRCLMIPSKICFRSAVCQFIPLPMVIRADAPYKNLKEFVEWGKKRDQVTASVSTKAGSVDITFQALGKATGLKIVTIPFRGGADAVTAIVGGQTDCGGNHPSEIISHIKAKRLIPIGVALEQRDPAIPDVPTFKELGYHVVSVGSVKGVAAPKGTPPEVIQYLTDRFKKVCDDPEFIKEYERYRAAGHVSRT